MTDTKVNRRIDLNPAKLDKHLDTIKQKLSIRGTNIRAVYEYIISECQKQISNVQTGIFGADMKISIENDGPFTIILDSEELAI